MIIIEDETLIIPIGLGPNFGKVRGDLEKNKIVDSSTNKQKIYPDAGYAGFDSVTVNPYALDEKTVNPTISTQEITSDVDGLSKVTINPVTSDIDANIKPTNIKKDISILGVVGTLESTTGPTAGPVEYISSENNNDLVFNTGYIPNENTKVIARISCGGENPLLNGYGNLFGVQDKWALREWGGYGQTLHGQLSGSLLNSGVTLPKPADIDTVMNIEVGNFYTNIDGTEKDGQHQDISVSTPIFLFAACRNDRVEISEYSSRIMRFYSFYIYEGNTLVKNLIPYHDIDNVGCFYEAVSGEFIYPYQGTATIGPDARYQKKTANASTVAVEVTPDSGFEAMSKVTINPVTADIDSNIVPSNIASGVNILGVTGSFSGAIYHRVGYVSNNAAKKRIFRNTGIIPTNNTRIEATISFEDIPVFTGGFGYFYGTTHGKHFTVREFSGYGARNITYTNPNYIQTWTSDMSPCPRTYTCGQVENEYSFMSWGGYIDKRASWSYTWSEGDGIFIWAANKGNNTVDEYSSRVMRLYDFKIYEGDNLVFHGVPVADNEGNYALLDLVTNALVKGDGELTGGGVYVEPDFDNYIMNTDNATNENAAYFDLGTTNYIDRDSWIDAQAEGYVSGYLEVIGSGQAAGTSIYFGAIDGTNKVGIQTGANSVVGCGVDWTPISDLSSFMNKYTINVFRNHNPAYRGLKFYFSVNDVPKVAESFSLTKNMSNNLYIFAINDTSIVKSAPKTKIYQIRYFNTADNEVHVLVPAYNEGKYCFHDLISDTYMYAVEGVAVGNVKDHFLENNGAIEVSTE